MGKYSRQSPARKADSLLFQTRDEKYVEVIVQRLKSLRYHHLSWPCYTFWRGRFWKGCLPVLEVAMQGAAGCSEASSSLSPFFISSLLALQPSSTLQTGISLVSWDSHTDEKFPCMA